MSVIYFHALRSSGWPWVSRFRLSLVGRTRLQALVKSRSASYLFILTLVMMDHKKPQGCVIPLKAMAWNVYTVISVHISLTEQVIWPNPTLTRWEKYLPILLGSLRQVTLMFDSNTRGSKDWEQWASVPPCSPFSRSITSSSSGPQSIHSLTYSCTHILSHSLYFYFIFEYSLLTMLW